MMVQPMRAMPGAGDNPAQSPDGAALRSNHNRRLVLVRLVYPKLGARPIADILRSEIVRLLDSMT